MRLVHVSVSLHRASNSASGSHLRLPDLCFNSQLLDMISVAVKHGHVALADLEEVRVRFVRSKFNVIHHGRFSRDLRLSWSYSEGVLDHLASPLVHDV